MMTQYAGLTRIVCHKLLALALLLVMLTACTVYPDGVGRTKNYLPISSCCGLLMGAEGKNPEFVVSNQFGITMLTDKRIIGTWSFQQGVNNVVLLSDGTASTTTPSRFTRNGEWQWASGNIILIVYSESEYDIVRFDMVDNSGDMAIVGIISHNTTTPAVFLGVKVQHGNPL